MSVFMRQQGKEIFMIEYQDVLPLSFLKKSRFTGSDRGMRYCIRKTEAEEISYLEASACPGPFSVDLTKEELFRKKTFPFTTEGKEEAVDWLNSEYKDRESLYQDVYEHPMRYVSLHGKER